MNTPLQDRWSVRAANKVFILYVVYLSLVWMMFNYGGKGIDPYIGGGLRWFLITIPLLTYIAISFMLLVCKAQVKVDSFFIFLLMYLTGVAFTSTINSDLKHFSEAARWIVPVILIAHFRVTVPLKVLNNLYLAAIVILIINYNPAITDYGYLPGQTTVNLHQGLWWRISIWTYVTPPYSAAFSLLVFFANYFMNPSRSRYVFYLLALYFLVLSGSRTSYFIFIFCGSVVYFLDSKHFRFRLLYCFIPFFAVSVIAGLQFFADLIPLLNIQNEFFNSVVLRNDGVGDASNLSSRASIIVEHWRYIQNSDFSYGMGVGSNIYNSTEWSVNGGTLGGTTDSFVSHLVARDGVSSIFLILAFVCLFVKAMKEGNLLAYVILMALLIFTIGYGAWLNSTSPVFMLFLGFLYHHPCLSRKIRRYD